MYRVFKSGLLVALFAAAVPGQQNQAASPAVVGEAKVAPETARPPADEIVSSLTNADLQALVSDVLIRNPSLARAAARARAAKLRAPQVRALPDPVAGVTAWLNSPETRTGPQVLTLSWVQSLPWLGKFDLEEQSALLEASALSAEVQAVRLELVTTIRQLYYDLAFLVRYREITEDYLDHLRQHEEISQSRYATGIGASLDVVKIQAEVTLAETLLLDIDQRRVDLESRINRLRDRPAASAILPAILPTSEVAYPEFDELLGLAARRRPEVTAVDARIAAAEARIKLADKAFRPDFSVGLTYTFVEPRGDAAGRLDPPEGNGDDIFGIGGGISVPIWRRKLDAGLGEATELELAAHEAKRELLTEIETALGELTQRIPLTWEQLRLMEDILILQAAESVRSAESGYVSGTFNALDLLDAEHVLFDTETAVARARADYAIRVAELEGAVGSPLQRQRTTE